MSDGQKTYSIYRLGATTDLDTVTALKKMSRGEYFERLSEFADIAPGLVRAMKAGDLDVKLPACAEALEKLQAMTLGIGSPSLIWKMAKLVSSLHWGKKDSMAESAMVVQKSVDTMCAQIRDAEIPQTGASGDGKKLDDSKEIQDASNSENASLKAPLQKAPVNSEIFEKTFLLVENQEYEPAIVDLQALLSFSYQPEIDGHLAELLSELHSRQYASARMRVEILRRLVETASNASQGAARKKQILAIDDVPDVLRILQTGLKDRFDVIGVTNHMTALKYLSTHTADLILLDIEMPDMDGFTLLDIIRKLENYKTTPVLFLTANASAEYVKMAIEHGGNDFIRKPVDLQLLGEKITRHLQPDGGVER